MFSILDLIQILSVEYHLEKSYFSSMHQPLISILTPFKNSSPFLLPYLESILSQTYSNWELIIVHDNSVDNSYDLVVPYAQREDRIKLIKNQGNGIIDALKLAFKNSNGQYITRMDGDDLMVPEKLEMMHQDLKTHGNGHIALGLVNYFCDGQLGEGYQNYESWLNGLTKLGTNYSEIYKECPIPSPCWMVSRNDLIKCGGFENDIYPEDYDLAFRFYKHGIICLPSNQVLHHWRDYHNRTSRIDEHYADNHFLKLKLHYFLELDYNSNRPLVLWGAGFKGKFYAKILKRNKVPFIWICNNPKKIGKHIYKIKLHDVSALKQYQKPHVIVTVANKTSQKRITAIIENHRLTKAKDYFFFC